MATSDLPLLETLLQEWRVLLILWAQNGTLTRAAQQALQLEGEPEKLRELVGEWSKGDFRNLPPVVLLPASAMPGAVGAYAISTGTIYLNQDLVTIASKEKEIAVLNEELGHHLDDRLNGEDTPGDEGEIFAALLLSQKASSDHLENDHGFLRLGATLLSVEMSAPSDLSVNLNSSNYTSNRFSGSTAIYGFQCTTYAYGRALEKGLYNSNFTIFKALDRRGADGGVWDDYTGIQSRTPVANSFIVWDPYTGGTGKEGHVGFVERILSDGTLIITEANYPLGTLWRSVNISPGSTRYNSAKFIPLSGGSVTPPLPPPPSSADPRLVLPIFDPAYYLAAYADVSNAYGASNHDGARSHWLQYGINEGRRGSLVFDPKDYLQRYQDVANAYGATNYAGAISHWLEWGLKDGRRGSQEFDPIYYMAAHPDVEQAYGVKNFSGAISHYYQWGKPGGWYGSEWITDQNAFQLWYYLNNNADVKAVTANANQEVEATRHWYFIGINEGRRGSAELDSKFYLANNPDVRAAYGEGNYRGAIDHYLLFGKPTGRAGANDTPRTISIGDVSIGEGNNGARELSFVVSLNVVSGETVAVELNTSNGTAESGSDYSAMSGSLSFAPGETSKTVAVQINGDSTHEGDEAFYVNLSGASNAVITRSQGVGTILNDDPANNVPTALSVSATVFGENIAAGSTVATLATTDPDAGNTFTYSLVSGTGDADNGAFSISSNQLSIKASPDFETKPSYSVRLRSTDQDGLSIDRALSLTVNNLNEAPTALTLSTTTFNEAIAAGSTVATLASTDPDPGNTFSYSLVSGSGDTDNNAFSISGNQLSIKASPDFETKSSYSIRLRSTDQGGLSIDRAVPLIVNNLNEAPSITDVSDNVGLIQGIVAANGRTNDTRPTITGSISAALAAGETLRIYNGAILLGSATVNNTARIWSYTPTLPVTEATTYAITARVADAAGNLGTASAARRFVLDTSTPVITSLTPQDGAAGVMPAANITLTFAESMRRGSGAIELRLGSASGTLVESFEAATSNRISIRGNRITLDITADLAPNTRYFLTLLAGSFTDLAGNAAAAISNYDFRIINAVNGTSTNDTLSFSSTVDQLTGLAGVDRFRLSSLQHALLPADPATLIDRITDLLSGVDRIDAPVGRTLAQAVAPVQLGSVSALNTAAVAELLTPAAFPAFTTTSTTGVAAFTSNDPTAGIRTFLAINNDVAGFSAASDAILEITGYSGNLSSLQVY